MTWPAVLARVLLVDPELRQTLDTLQQRVALTAEAVQAAEQRMGARMTEAVQAAEQRMIERMTEQITASAAETRRHTAVLVEALRSDFRVATDAIVPLIHRMDGHEEQSERTRQRVDLLEIRVSALERPRTPRRRRSR